MPDEFAFLFLTPGFSAFGSDKKVEFLSVPVGSDKKVEFFECSSMFSHVSEVEHVPLVPGYGLGLLDGFGFL